MNLQLYWLILDGKEIRPHDWEIESSMYLKTQGHSTTHPKNKMKQNKANKNRQSNIQHNI